MSLFETSDSTGEVRPEHDDQAPLTPLEAAATDVAGPPGKITDAFEELLENLMIVRERDQTKTANGFVLIYRGHLLRPASEIFPKLSDTVEGYGFTLYLQCSRAYDEVLLAEGILQTRNVRAPWWFHLGLLLATMITTLVAAALLHGYTVESIRVALADLDRLTLLQIYRRARVFAWPLLLILGFHEMGHYIAARLHGVKVTLPFFIPLPLFGSLGTLGAVIFIRSPFQNRKQLFDVGIAGPLAGLLIAIPIFVIGLDQTPDIPMYPRQWIGAFNRVSVPPFLEFIAWLTRGSTGNLDRSLFYNHPQALAAWFGVLLTSLNLLPMGQFDGGHVAFAVFGRGIAWPLARITAVVCVSLGVTGLIGYSQAWPIWFIWPLFAYFSGLRHPPPHDDITSIGWPRKILGMLTFVLLFTMMVITPFYSTFR